MLRQLRIHERYQDRAALARDGKERKEMLGLDSYSEEIAVGIKNVLMEDDIDYYFDDAAGFFSFYLNIDGKGIDRLHYLITVDEEAFLLYAISPLNADCDNRRMMNALSEFINRANYRLHVGNFQLNFKTGELRIKIFHNPLHQLK